MKTIIVIVALIALAAFLLWRDYIKPSGTPQGGGTGSENHGGTDHSNNQEQTH